MKNFEDYLQEQHMAQYEGADDDAPDDFNSWLGTIEVSKWLEYGDAYAKITSLSEPH